MKRRYVLILTLLGSLLLPWPAARLETPLTTEEQTVKDALQALLSRQDDAVLRTNERALRTVYTRSGSTDALRHARARQEFLHAWQAARRVKIEGVTVELRTPAIKFSGKDRVRVTAVVSEAFRYRQQQRDAQQEVFGLGTRRWYVLQKERGWRIRSEDYTDPLDQDTRIPGEAMPAVNTRELAQVEPPHVILPAAERAVRYADTYCGAAPGCGNGRRYNPRYNDFNGEGGDCTNFVSQSLRAAGFRQTGKWSWDAGKGDGTRAWSNADGLADYLVGSGRAQVVGSGTYTALTHPLHNGSPAPISRLAPGDIIGYRERGRIVHLGLVVGRSPSNYVIVDTHTADRFHVPWDIGWDRSTRFVLLKLRYPEEQRAFNR
ncbi:MAG: amidase domain-containing protein [Thermaerobacter sp.]|nr:amidase domain-containing protein [Thermaerobacter sp.]